MHHEARVFVSHFASTEPLKIIEIGARRLNGDARDFFPNAIWTGLDLMPGDNVDIVIDAEHYRPAELVDMVLILEVLEHAPNWRELIRVAATWLRDDGRLIVTCAGPGRPEHSAIDGRPRLQPGEYYGNLTALEVASEMRSAGFGWIESDQVGNDTQAMGWRIARD